MSSVEGSERGDRDDESLSQEELEIFIKNNKVQKHRLNFRGSRAVNSQQSIYKEALKEYMFGRFDMASQSCKKMIASNPQNPQPYFLMGTMHQQAATRNNDEGELAKSVEYFFFHAYYSQPSEEKWLKVAELSKDLRLYQQAAYCYGRALKIKTNLGTFMERARCLEQCMEIKKAANIYKRILEKFSTSAQVYKRYAKLRFQREQYSKARQILVSYPDYKSDWAIQFMIAQTLQRQKKYTQLYNFICDTMIANAQEPIANIYEDLEIQILQMIFICRVNSKDRVERDIDLGEMLKFFLNSYHPKYTNLYQQIVEYIKDTNPTVTFELLKEMVKYEQHQTIENYLFCSEHLQKTGHCQEAIKFLENGLSTKKCQNSAELKTQQNYLKSLLKNKNRVQNNVKGSVAKQKNFKESQDKVLENDIFFSDEEEEVHKKQEEEDNSIGIFQKKEQQISLFQDRDSQQFFKPPKQKTKKITKSKKPSIIIHHIEAKDPQIIGKLITNNQLTLESLKNEIQHISQSSTNGTPESEEIQQALHRTLSQVQECLGYLVEVQSNRGDKGTFYRTMPKMSSSIYNNREPKKRRMLGGGCSRRYNLISRNSQSLVTSLKYVIFFMKEYIKAQKYNQVVEFAQILSKAHFFKWQNRITQFKVLKMEVYEIGVLACLELKKYSKSIFFLRYLINKNPVNDFYLALAQRIMRLSTGKLFINKMLKKGLQPAQSSSASQKESLKIFYMAGLQYMQNSFFELAINMFTKVQRILQQQPNLTPKQQQMCKTTYMCMTACFLQIASSRTVFNKLDFVNRSAYCLTRYMVYCEGTNQNHMQGEGNQDQNVNEDNLGKKAKETNQAKGENSEIMYNQARWYSFVRLFSVAIPLYQKILEAGEREAMEGDSERKQLCERAALNLMVIFKDQGEFEEVRKLSEKYFAHKQNIPDLLS